MTPTVRNFLLLLALGACWGPSFLFIKIAVEYVPPIAITAVRMAVGFAILFTILKIRKIKLPPLRPVIGVLTVSALLQGAIPFSLFGVSEKSLSSSFAAIFTGVVPLFAMIMAHYLIPNDRLSKAKIIGATLGFSGLFLLIMPSLFSAKADSFGVVALTLATTCYAAAFVYSKKYINIKAFPPLVIPTVQLFISFVVLTVASMIFENSWSVFELPIKAIMSLLGLGVLGTAAAFVVYYKLLDLTSVSYISMVNYLVPIFGAALGMLVLGEELSWNSYLGGILIVSGVMTANGVIRFNKFLAK